MLKRLFVSRDLLAKTCLVVVVLLGVPLAVSFTMFSPGRGTGPGGTAGRIFDKRISGDVFYPLLQSEQAAIKEEWKQQLGGQIPPSLEPVLTQQAVAQTWNTLMLLEEAKRRRIMVSDQDVLAAIEAMPTFQVNGRFDSNRYRQLLRYDSGFERRLRQRLMVTHLIDMVRQSMAVTADEVRGIYVRQHEQLVASLFVFDPQTFTAQATAGITEEELKRYYDTHQDEFRIPEQISFEYLGASAAELAGQITIPDADLEAYYQAHPQEFRGDTGAKPFSEVQEMLRQRVQTARATQRLTTVQLDLQEDLEAGFRFEEIALHRGLTSKSFGPTSATDVWAAGAPEPTLMQAAAALPMGQLSKVVTTPNGVYVARLTQRTPTTMAPLDQRRDQLRTRVAEAKANAAAKQAAVDAHAALTKQLAAGWRFEEAVLVVPNLPSAQQVRFTRTDELAPLGRVTFINDTAFATPLGHLTDVLDAPETCVILRPEERIIPDLTHLAAQESALRQDLVNQKLQAWFEDLKTRAKLHSFVNVPNEPSPTSP